MSREEEYRYGGKTISDDYDDNTIVERVIVIAGGGATVTVDDTGWNVAISLDSGATFDLSSLEEVDAMRNLLEKVDSVVGADGDVYRDLSGPAGRPNSPAYTGSEDWGKRSEPTSLADEMEDEDDSELDDEDDYEESSVWEEDDDDSEYDDED